MNVPAFETLLLSVDARGIATLIYGRRRKLQSLAI